MTISKKKLPENQMTSLPEEDDYYATERQRIAQETERAKRIHKEDVHLHLVAHIPYYEDASEWLRSALVRLNNILLHRFDKPGMIIWDFLKKTPTELYDYAKDFDNDISPDDQKMIVEYLERKKQEDASMVEMGFDEDGEEDDIVIGDEDKEETDEEGEEEI